MGIADDINTIARFIACEDIPGLQSINPVDCIILCVSSVLHSPETVFNIIQARPSITKTLVLCGGIGHSTEPIYDAVARHPRFRDIAADVGGLPEAQVLHVIFERFYASQFAEDDPAPTILLEDRSITCATNATEARKLLEANGLGEIESMVIVQDPTMVRRTVECFKKAYEGAAHVPRFEGCPVFVPVVGSGAGGGLEFSAPVVAKEDMWPMERYLELVMGEIPRMRDDGNGYGPKGKGVIPHVDIPVEVEKAYGRLCDAIPNRRYKSI
ncbi:hypothetical protein BU24DRAFT_445722 [Aaosphaeria arxii CBS 175.79]|uniref:Uncharacterized protein n=1 Tax=Aaosphaeria arxii CBS 175.79 TaxID=1450172 RepID=A0A6A5Y7I4_9PLEO|nr:uncharacterized protein BU24DRAFT_445722 [Aaosphaeria arxii CBS 175.79]KAF2020514.1 hypothetical protein BU24DRAFT_445722 [Aaosphaeria arxii CBS 175.79]